MFKAVSGRFGYLERAEQPGGGAARGNECILLEAASGGPRVHWQLCGYHAMSADVAQSVDVGLACNDGGGSRKVQKHFWNWMCYRIPK